MIYAGYEGGNMAEKIHNRLGYAMLPPSYFQNNVPYSAQYS